MAAELRKRKGGRVLLGVTELEEGDVCGGIGLLLPWWNKGDYIFHSRRSWVLCKPSCPQILQKPQNKRLQRLAKKNPSPREPPQPLAFLNIFPSASEEKNPATVTLPRCPLLFCFKLLEHSPIKTVIARPQSLQSCLSSEVPNIFNFTESGSVVGMLGWWRGRGGGV